MPPIQQKEEFFVHSSFIPYSIFFEALKIGHQLCVQKKKVSPNKYILYLSHQDRVAREKYEHIFIEEMVQDLMLLSSQDFRDAKKVIHFEIRTESNFDVGHIRVEFYDNETGLFKFEQEIDPLIKENFEESMQEWNAMDMMEEKIRSDKSILVVDDEAVLCVVLGKMLRKLGYNAICAYNGMDAVKILEHMDFDLVISDLRMPHMDGWALMKYVKNENPSIPVILITGYHSLYTAQKSKHQSADGYLSKPFSMHQIGVLCEKLLDKKEARSSVRRFSEKE